VKEVVIVSACRTAIGAFGGSLKEVPLVQLGVLAAKGAMAKAHLRPAPDAQAVAEGPDALKALGPCELEARAYAWDSADRPVVVDEVILGNVVSAGQGQNVARQVAVRAGFSKETTGMTVNKLCASGMKAVALGAQAIAAGAAEVVLAGGMENMSRIPYAVPSGRWGARMNDAAMVDLLIFDGLQESFHGYHMGLTAENIAERYGFSRAVQDELGVLSHQRALKAIAAGIFADEIVPVPLPQRKGDPVDFAVDERPMETSLEKMARLRPAFKKDGTVTAGNASGINDAAAALLLMSREKAAELGLTPLARVRAYAAAGLDPAYMGLGPIPAVRRLLRAQKLAIGDFGVIELNEAFASQALACVQELGCDMERVNPLGSGISLGHPIGCTGARILVTLLGQMRRGGHPLGLASLCIGGGMGMAMALEQI
jgi:acetyl-CoA C-acetyltransferase